MLVMNKMENDEQWVLINIGILPKFYPFICDVNNP